MWLEQTKKYLTCLFDPRLAASAVIVSLIYGSILFIINHLEALIENQMTFHRWISALLSYLVPYMVSIHGRFSEKTK